MSDYVNSEILKERYLSSVEEEEIKRYMQELMSGRYFCYYNRNDRLDYEKLVKEKYKNIMIDRLESVGFELIYNENFKTIYLKRQEEIGSKRNLFDINVTKIVCLMRAHFLKEMNNVDTKNTAFYRWNDILKDLAPFLKKNNRNNIISAVWKLKDIGVIDTNAKKRELTQQDEEGKIVFEIFPSIGCLCSMQDLALLEEMLDSLTNNIVVDENEGE